MQLFWIIFFSGLGCPVRKMMKASGTLFPKLESAVCQKSGIAIVWKPGSTEVTSYTISYMKLSSKCPFQASIQSWAASGDETWLAEWKWWRIPESSITTSHFPVFPFISYSSEVNLQLFPICHHVKMVIYFVSLASRSIIMFLQC